ncbi:hypothetical protein AVEN_275656-1 [Araneus ventricosus]|uniref:Uncharacterized protein n=1 Tax=Araneus ventricosus TaxID=182803 RepID=A0A4Y2EXE9_ARAVE|nr:hypothetical protein AVEN_275656-1 [Araneus ventricosus]
MPTLLWPPPQLSSELPLLPYDLPLSEFHRTDSSAFSSLTHQARRIKVGVDTLKKKKKAEYKKNYREEQKERSPFPKSKNGCSITELIDAPGRIGPCISGDARNASSVSTSD